MKIAQECKESDFSKMISEERAEVTTDKTKLQPERIAAMLKTTCWAKSRPPEKITASVKNSLCFAVLVDGLQVGFARVITDYVTTYYICDVVIDIAYRGQGLGKLLVKTIVEDERLQGLYGILATASAHGLYEKFGFRTYGDSFMNRRPQPVTIKRE